MSGSWSLNFKNVFISAGSGCGKTTLIKEVTLPYREKIAGFYIDKIENDGKKCGFSLNTFSGKSCKLAGAGIKSGPKISKYRVDLEALDCTASDELDKGLKCGKIIVVDEVGSIEALSEKFRVSLINCLNSPNKVVATVRNKSKPFADEIKRISDTVVIELNKDNFVLVKNYLRQWFEKG